MHAPDDYKTVIKNGLYFYSSKARDGVDGGADGVMILRDGTMLGGTEFFYFVGTYTCSNGKWKGEFINEEHTPAPITRPMARRGTVSCALAHAGRTCRPVQRSPT